MNDFTNRLRLARLNRKISQRRLAPKIGVDHKAISNWERGTKQPLVGNFIAWAQALGYDIRMELK